VSNALISLAVMCHANFEGLDYCFEKTGVHTRSAMVPSDRLSIVTMLLTKVVWPQFAMQVFGMQSVSQFGENSGVIRHPF